MRRFIYWLSASFIALFTLLLPSSCNFPSDQKAQAIVASKAESTRQSVDFLASAQANLAAEKAIRSTDEHLASLPTDTPAPLPTSTPDPNRKAPELPPIFTTDLLNKLDYPHTYEEDVCVFLKNRWSAGKAAPGAVVMTIMYHSIIDDVAASLDNQITAEKNVQIMDNLYAQGFTAIDMEQFIGFMKNNDYIPDRSVLLISDDRHRAGYFETHFLPFYQKYGWKVVNAWISHPDTTADLWEENVRIEQEGYVDHQAHGVIHNVNMTDSSSDEFLTNELEGSVIAIQKYFNKTPRGIIWPGGNFGARPIEFAKKYGFEVGFTVNPRGPVMYNWVPLADAVDPGRPSYLADGSFDPLFVIPRYWNTDVSQHIDTARQIGKAAKEQIMANRDIELEYYDIVCKPKIGGLDE